VWLAGLSALTKHHSLVTLLCSLSVALSARWRFSLIIITGDARYSLPHPLLCCNQTSSTYLLSHPSRLQRVLLPSPSTANPNPLSLSKPDQSCSLQHPGPACPSLATAPPPTAPPPICFAPAHLALALLLPICSSSGEQFGDGCSSSDRRRSRTCSVTLSLRPLLGAGHWSVLACVPRSRTLS